MESIYPIGIAANLQERWKNLGLPDASFPSERQLQTLVDVAYQTSLLEEEGRHVMARMALVNNADDETCFSNEQAVLSFKSPIPLTLHNVRKLAAAVSFYRSVFLVSPGVDGEQAIRGMLTTGTEWVHHIEGSRASLDGLQGHLIIHVIGPGHLQVTYGNQRVIESRAGKVLADAFDPFRSAWLPARFGSVRESLIADLSLEVQSGSTRICESFVKDVAQGVVRRALRLARTRRHGGMLVYLPLGTEGDCLADEWFRFRVRFASGTESQRFRLLMLRLMERAYEVGNKLGLRVVTWQDYQQMEDSELASIDREIIDFAHLLADLMDIDGSLILDRSFRLIGFGAEILGDSHAKVVHRAIDLEATQTVAEPADSAGTRHRAAYRLITGMPEAVAVVVSQDGDVRFVARQHGRTTYWPYLP